MSFLLANKVKMMKKILTYISFLASTAKAVKQGGMCVKHSIRVVLLLCGCVLLIGCSKFHNLPDAVKPASWILDMVPKDAPPKIQQAWLDGCKSGMGTMTNSGYRSLYRFTQDPVLRKDPAYYKVWKDIYTFCRHYAYGVIRQSNTRSRLSNNIPSLLERIGGAHNLLEYNLGNWWGPPGQGVWFKDFGYIEGNPYPGDIGGMSTLDYSGDFAWSGTRGGEHMNWNFTPNAGFKFYQ